MPTKSFRLTRYFTITSFIAVALVALALVYFEHSQGQFFQQVQEQQSELFKQVQDDFAKQQEDVARRDLLAIHEGGNVNLTRLFANALWENDFAPFVLKAQSIPVDHCRAKPDPAIPEPDKNGEPLDTKKSCLADVGKQIMAFPEFSALDAKVVDAMKRSTTFKIKVFDLRGITVYSSEHKQIGEDKRNNAGWQGAVSGKPKSELTFRKTFSAFEGVVENRDLISSYLPVLAPGSDRIVGVFEIYSDVTPFLNRIKQTAIEIAQKAADTQAKVQHAAVENQAKVEQVSIVSVGVVVGLLGLLYAILFFVVKRAQNMIDHQEEERKLSQQRLSQAEKMASLGQMVAGIAHQLNTPLAFSENNVQMAKEAVGTLALPVKTAQDLAKLSKSALDQDQVTIDVSEIRQELEQIHALDTDVQKISIMLDDIYNGVGQMAEMVTHLQDFTHLDQRKWQEADINNTLRSVVYIARSVISSQVELIEIYYDVPLIECDVSQLNQVLLNLINNAAQAIVGDGKIWVRTQTTPQGGVQIEVEDTGYGISADILPHIFDLYFTTKPQGEGNGMGLHIAKDIIDQHGGKIEVQTEDGKGSVFTVTLPANLVHH
ncbi:sensor histidine kinase [Candidatus Entotheonella palauensis]|uniref:histidine kinase n=1 Tax=Candidatus Entotheonella gemina TaxID=1429439 RepID=W4M3A7_9BACT|nr:HAMP domain-containing sensor histidine kinase [Candidatus Entotheonella palauensis]ETX04663.1 MAG: hypothetical protein ETSY2_27490 [Candidatus Entotheonella gemina]